MKDGHYLHMIIKISLALCGVLTIFLNFPTLGIYVFKELDKEIYFTGLVLAVLIAQTTLILSLMTAWFTSHPSVKPWLSSILKPGNLSLGFFLWILLHNYAIAISIIITEQLFFIAPNTMSSLTNLAVALNILSYIALIMGFLLAGKLYWQKSIIKSQNE